MLFDEKEVRNMKKEAITLQGIGKVLFGNVIGCVFRNKLNVATTISYSLIRLDEALL